VYNVIAIVARDRAAASCNRTLGSVFSRFFARLKNAHAHTPWIDERAVVVPRINSLPANDVLFETYRTAALGTKIIPPPGKFGGFFIERLTPTLPSISWLGYIIYYWSVFSARTSRRSAPPRDLDRRKRGRDDGERNVREPTSNRSGPNGTKGRGIFDRTRIPVTIARDGSESTRNGRDACRPGSTMKGQTEQTVVCWKTAVRKQR